MVNDLTREKVLAVMYRLRRYLASDGGDIKLVDLREDGTVVVHLLASCGENDFLLSFREDIERELREAVPELTTIEVR